MSCVCHSQGSTGVILTALYSVWVTELGWHVQAVNRIGMERIVKYNVWRRGDIAAIVQEPGRAEGIGEVLTALPVLSIEQGLSVTCVL